MGVLRTQPGLGELYSPLDSVSHGDNTRWGDVQDLSFTVPWLGAPSPASPNPHLPLPALWGPPRAEISSAVAPSSGHSNRAGPGQSAHQDAVRVARDGGLVRKWSAWGSGVHGASTVREEEK